MNEIIVLLPLYLLGNLHCIGMCGPLVALLGRSPFAFAYFLGRLCGFTLAGMLAGEMGALISLALHLPLFFSFFFLFLGLTCFFPIKLPKSLGKVSLLFSKLLLKERFFPIFLFGMATILLPCGQSLMVFSTSALLGGPLLGGCNALLFALVTTPSLWCALQAANWLKSLSRFHRPIMGFSMFTVALLLLLREAADDGFIHHLALNNHIVLY